MKNRIKTICKQLKEDCTLLSIINPALENYISNFEPTTILNNATYDAYGFFDAKDWNDSLDNNTAYGFGISESLVDVFVKSEFYPNASVIYDTEPPYGAIILNKKSDDVDPGVKVHYFSGLGYSSLTVTEK